MAALLELKEHLKSFYSKYEAYIIPVLKFSAALAALLLVNGELGYMSELNSLAIVLVAALFCSFLPLNFIIMFAALFAIGHIYRLSWECAVGVLVLFLLLFFLYFRFSPKDTIVIVLIPVCFSLKVPAVIPLAMGLVGGPASMISVGCGVIVYYVLSFVSNNAAMINSLDPDGSLTRFRYLIDGVMNNRAMLITVISFAVTILLVYIIRRLPVDHCWTYAMVAGALMNIVIQMLGDLKYRTNISIMGTILGSIVAVGIVKILQFFVFNVDYSRTEHVQFEDDEYYYYVKAVPKMSVAISDKTVTRIDTKKPEGQTRVHSSAVVSAQAESVVGSSQSISSGNAGNGRTTVNRSTGSSRTTENRSTGGSRTTGNRSAGVNAAGANRTDRTRSSSGSTANGGNGSAQNTTGGSSGSSRNTTSGSSGSSRNTTSGRSTTGSGSSTAAGASRTRNTTSNTAGNRTTSSTTGSTRSTTGSSAGNSRSTTSRNGGQPQR